MPELIIPAIIGSVGSVAGAGIAAHATGSAVKAQQKGTNQGIAAITAGKNQATQTLGQVYQQSLGNLAPYTTLGQAGTTELMKRLGLSAPTTAPTGATPGGAAPGGAAPVMMRAPDGSTKQVDPSQVDYYTKKGGVVVG